MKTKTNVKAGRIELITRDLRVLRAYRREQDR